MLRLAMETLALSGYTVASIYHGSDITSIPIPFVGLAWLIAVRCIPPSVDPAALFWVTYGLLVYQLISFHDLDACFLDECKTSELFSYISIGSTAVFWFSMREKSTGKYTLKAEPKVEPKAPTLEPVKLMKKDVFPLKIRINKTKPSGPIKLKMGPSLQARWV